MDLGRQELNSNVSVGLTVMVGVEEGSGDGVEVLETETAVGGVRGGVPQHAVRKKIPMISPVKRLFMVFLLKRRFSHSRSMKKSCQLIADN